MSSDVAANKPCEHCGRTDRPRSEDRFGNWLCDQCAAAEAAVEWDEN
jgi:ribosomal protein L37AE/L43A